MELDRISIAHVSNFIKFEKSFDLIIFHTLLSKIICVFTFRILMLNEYTIYLCNFRMMSLEMVQPPLSSFVGNSSGKLNVTHRRVFTPVSLRTDTILRVMLHLNFWNPSKSPSIKIQVPSIGNSSPVSHRRHSKQNLIMNWPMASLRLLSMVSCALRLQMIHLST